jgi:hypothetical protein
VKLRILGNSIRLRVAKSELAELGSSGTVADAIHFGSGQQLSYRINAGHEGSFAAHFAESEIIVTVPVQQLRGLVETEQVSIRGEQSLPGGEALKILVEKDFECLVPRPGEDPRDLYDNPARA